MTIRKLQRMYFEEVLAIEAAWWGGDAWTYKDVHKCAQSNFGRVCVDSTNRVLGYMMYTNRLLYNICVHPDSVRTGVGSKLIETTLWKFDYFELYVNEINTTAQLFFNYHGFAATKVIKNYWPGANAIHMFRRSHPENVDAKHSRKITIEECG